MVRRRTFSKREKVEFKCPVCGNEDYEEVFQGRKGGKSRRASCFCPGCTVVFYNPEKFSCHDKKDV